MDDVRAMLDQLMGQERNLSLDERKYYKPKKRSYKDKDVCKYYLVGFCPYEEFRRTKNDCGDCPCVHDEDAKQEWDALDERSKERSGYEEDLKRWMDRLLVDLRKRIDTNTERLKATEKPLFLVEDQQRLDAMTGRIAELLARSQALGEQGDVDGSQHAMMEAEQVKAQRAVLEQQAQSRAGNNAAKNLQQAVCPLSGLIINKEESRIKDHLEGRNYNSWKKLHEVYNKLVEDLRKREVRRRGPGGPPRGPAGYPDRPDRPERRERERERDRGDPRDSRPRDRDERSRSTSYRDDRSRSTSYRDDRSRSSSYRDERGGRDYRGRDDRRDRDSGRQGSRRDRERTPPRRPKVDEADFVVEYVNDKAAAEAAARQQKGGPGAPADAQAYGQYDPGYDPASYGAAAVAVPASGAEAQDWGVDYGPAKPLQHDNGAYYAA